ncbi:hypothetical protein IJX73_06545 [bacterium]|nr:hypothetical protein [bacterium]
MQLSATNLINFKSRYQEYDCGFDFEDVESYNNALKMVDEVQDKFVPSSDIKPMLPLAAAVGAMFGKLGLKGAATALLIDQTTKNKASNAFDSLLKQGVEKVQELGISLVKKPAKGIVKNVKKTIGEGLQNYSEQFGKTIAKNGAIKNFGLAGAAASILAFAPKALTADNNEDGISDIAQYSQVYDDSAAQLDKLQEKASVIGRFIAFFT